MQPTLDVLNKLDWNVTDFNVNNIDLFDPESITFNVTEYSFKQFLNRPFEPPLYEIILYFPLDTKDPHTGSRQSYLVRRVYRSETGFNAYDILGAINTFYNKPIDKNLVYNMAKQGYIQSIDLRNRDQQGLWLNNSLPNSYLLRWVGLFFRGIEPYQDGYRIIIGP